MHSRAGLVFVHAILIMCLAGFFVTVARDVAPATNIPAALLTGYLVVTGLATVRPPTMGARALSVVAMLLALAVGLASLTFGFQAVANGGTRNGMPAFPFFMFGIVGLLGSAGDIRVLRSGARQGASRLARHLWRMSFTLFIAALSFFIGRARVIPEPIRVMPVLALPVLAVLVTMLYWLWRVRAKHAFRGAVGVAPSAPVRAHI